MSSNCPFCDPAQAYRYVFDGTEVRVLYPLNPACAYHVLITPKRHVQHFDELTSSEVLESHDLLKRLATLCETNISDYIGYNLLSNNGDTRVNQQVPHCHIHAFMRTSRDASDPLKAPHTNLKELTQAQLEDMKTLRELFAKDA